MDKGYSDTEMLAELPGSLRTDCALWLAGETMRQVELFHELNASFLSAAVKRFTCALRAMTERQRMLHLFAADRTFAPGEYICLQGELALEMYFIRKGDVQVLVASACCSLSALQA